MTFRETGCSLCPHALASQAQSQLYLEALGTLTLASQKLQLQGIEILWNSYDNPHYI